MLQCVVQSYLAWLQDSDYNPNCEFCHGPLADDDCVRLVCYHLYHWVCLDHHCRSLPAATAPAGYTCPVCSAAIFPPDNLVSPVADQLRKVLQDVNWARAGLGLPLLEETAERKPGVVPAGPRPTPEGEDMDPIAIAQELVAKKAARAAATPASGGNWKEKDSAVVQFDTPTTRRGKLAFPFRGKRVHASVMFVPFRGAALFKLFFCVYRAGCAVCPQKMQLPRPVVCLLNYLCTSSAPI